MGYKVVNSRGQTYWLHQKGHLRFFSKKEEDSIDLPKGYVVTESAKTGLPILKRDQ